MHTNTQQVSFTEWHANCNRILSNLGFAKVGPLPWWRNCHAQGLTAEDAIHQKFEGIVPVAEIEEASSKEARAA